MKNVIRISYLIAMLSSLVLANAEQYASPADIPVQKFAQLPGLSDVALSPDGTHVAYLLPIEGRNNLIIQPLTGGAKVQIPPQKKLDMHWAHWANNETLVFSVGFSGQRWRTTTTETRLMSVKRDGEDIQQIVTPARKPPGVIASRPNYIPPQLQDDVIDWLPEDPLHILVSLDENLDSRSAVRKINVNTGRYRIIRKGVSGVQDWMSDGNGNIRLGYGYLHSKFGATFLTSDGVWKQAKRTDWWDQGFRPQAFTDKPDVVYAKGPNKSGIRVLQELNIMNGTLGDIVAGDDKFDVGTILTDSITGQPVGIELPSASSGVEYFDPLYQTLQSSLEKAMPGTSVRILSMSTDRRKLIVRTRSDQDPGSFYFWDRDIKKMDWFAESMPDIDPALMSKMEAISYTARDGTSIPGYLTFPIGSKRTNLPTIVLPHGGPHSRTDQNWWFLSQFLASRGYLVLQPNFRGSTGYGQPFQAAGQKQWGGLMQDDITDGTKWLIEKGYSNPDNISIVGWSYGGYAAAMGAVKTPELYRRAVSINGVMNLPTMISYEKNYIGGKSWTKSIGLDGELVKTVSPYHRANEIETPLLIIHANDDARVSVKQAKGMYNRMQQLDKEVQLVTVDLGGHSMTNEQARMLILESIENFLRIL